MNPMMMMMPNTASMLAQMPPEMVEISKRMFEQRQQLMQEFQAKGGQSNPAAVQELMAKAAQLQQNMMSEIKAKMESGSIVAPNLTLPSAAIPISPIDLAEKQAQAAAPIKPLGEGLLGANVNMSKLDELTNKRTAGITTAMAARRAREDEEQKILNAIASKDYNQLNAIKATQYGVLERLRELIESGQYDVNQPDQENVYLLHWAAINNRIEIAKYLIKSKPVGILEY